MMLSRYLAAGHRVSEFEMSRERGLFREKGGFRLTFVENTIIMREIRVDERVIL